MRFFRIACSDPVWSCRFDVRCPGGAPGAYGYKSRFVPRSAPLATSSGICRRSRAAKPRACAGRGPVLVRASFVRRVDRRAHGGDAAGGTCARPSNTVCCMVIGQRGAYPADRAAALSGVPLSTVHYWSRNDIVVPRVSAERVKLWSFSDLMALRIVYWLRQTKATADGAAVPRTRMSAVKRAVTQLGELDLGLWSETSGPASEARPSGQHHRPRRLRTGGRAAPA